MDRLRLYIKKALLKEASAQGNHSKAINDIMQRFELKESDKLLDGTYGSAFNYGTQLVLKITRDSSEAVFANNLKHKKFKHIANVESVFKMKNYPGYFVIILEKLQPIDNEYVLKSLEILPFFFNEDLMDDNEDWIKREFNKIPKDIFLKTQVQYKEIVDELEKTRLPNGYTDLHVGNIGIKNGNLACYDLQVVDLPQWRLGKIKSFK